MNAVFNYPGSKWGIAGWITWFFPEDYIIDRDDTGKSYSRAEQVKRCGNAICPPVAAARMPNMRIDASREQLSFVI